MDKKTREDKLETLKITQVLIQSYEAVLDDVVYDRKVKRLEGEIKKLHVKLHEWEVKRDSAPAILKKEKRARAKLQAELDRTEEREAMIAKIKRLRLKIARAEKDLS